MSQEWALHSIAASLEQIANPLISLPRTLEQEDADDETLQALLRVLALDCMGWVGHTERKAIINAVIPLPFDLDAYAYKTEAEMDAIVDWRRKSR